MPSSPQYLSTTILGSPEPPSGFYDSLEESQDPEKLLWLQFITAKGHRWKSAKKRHTGRGPRGARHELPAVLTSGVTRTAVSLSSDM